MDMGIGVNIDVEQQGSIYVVNLEGRLDASTTPVVEKKMAKLLESVDKIAVDFTEISYLSSAGMRLLLSTTKKMQAKQGNIAYFGLNDEVLEIIKIAGFERILHLFKSKKDALKYLQ